MRIIIALSVLAIGIAGAVAQNVDAIKARQTIYKAMGGATKAPSDMLKGAAPFDLAVVSASLDTYIDASKKLATLFPDDSKTGGDTQALPSIWEKKSDFDALMTKFGVDAMAAKASIKDEATFKTEFPKVVANCGACHRTFRAANR